MSVRTPFKIASKRAGSIRLGYGAVPVFFFCSFVRKRRCTGSARKQNLTKVGKQISSSDGDVDEKLANVGEHAVILRLTYQ